MIDCAGVELLTTVTINYRKGVKQRLPNPLVVYKIRIMKVNCN